MDTTTIKTQQGRRTVILDVTDANDPVFYNQTPARKAPTWSPEDLAGALKKKLGMNVTPDKAKDMFIKAINPTSQRYLDKVPGVKAVRVWRGRIMYLLFDLNKA
jgi:hypothetical protein|nr:MAG TPA: hypothetical protein [Caudoviricetes sp.]